MLKTNSASLSPVRVSLSPVCASPLVDSHAGSLQSSPPAWGSSEFFAQDQRNVDLRTLPSVRNHHQQWEGVLGINIVSRIHIVMAVCA